MAAQLSITSAVKQRVIFLVLDKVQLLDLAGPAQVFSMAASYGAPYSLHFCASSSEVRSAQGLFLGQLEPLLPVSADDLIMIAGIMLEQPAQPLLDAETRSWLLDAYHKGTRIASICSKCLFSKTKCSFTDSETNIATQDPEKPDGWFKHSTTHGLESCLLVLSEIVRARVVSNGPIHPGDAAT